MSRTDDLLRIRDALAAAADALSALGGPSGVAGLKGAAGVKEDRSPVTEADLALDATLRALLPRPGEGWLSEETGDSTERLRRERVWVVDPLDGTREFVDGVPEWCISVGLVEREAPVAGGILNPATGELFLGAVGHGLTLNGAPAGMRSLAAGGRCEVLASRTEVGRGEWEGVPEPFRVRAVGSVAYKLALVAAGAADATWTLSPKHEWDVAAGAALVLAAGGAVWTPGGGEPRFNQPKPWLPGLAAAHGGVADSVRRLLAAVPADGGSGSDGGRR